MHAQNVVDRIRKLQDVYFLDFGSQVSRHTHAREALSIYRDARWTFFEAVPPSTRGEAEPARGEAEPTIETHKHACTRIYIHTHAATFTNTLTHIALPVPMLIQVSKPSEFAEASIKFWKIRSPIFGTIFKK